MHHGYYIPEIRIVHPIIDPPLVCLQYRGTKARTLPLTLLDETDTHYVVRFMLAGKPIDGARYRKTKWEVVPADPCLACSLTQGKSVPHDPGPDQRAAEAAQAHEEGSR